MTESVSPATEPQDAKVRVLSPLLRTVFDALLVLLVILGAAWALQLQHYLPWAFFTEQYLALMLGVALICVFMGIRVSTKVGGTKVPWFDWLAILATIVVTGFVLAEYPTISRDIGTVTPARWLLGGVAIILILEATRRMVGWALVIVTLVFILYARTSDLMPGALFAPSIGWTELAAYLFLDTNSLFGIPLSVMASIIVAFILFGRILYALNADKFLTEFSLATMGSYRGGPAKVAIVASSLFGTISGSVVSNVVMDGPITIPMMVRAGYRRHVAAAIEAVASTGGQIMPPVMGITAFLIADWLNISYGEVILAALVPALLYYIALFVQVDLEAARLGLSGMPPDQIPKLSSSMRIGWVFAIPIAVLVYTLVVLGWQPGKSAMIATFVALAIGLLRKETRPTFRKVLGSIRDTGRTVLDLVVMTAAAGLVIGSLQISGLAFNVSLMLVMLAGGVLWLLLLLTGGLSIILGMGMPTSVIYILLAVLVAPSLTEFGVPELAAHLFIFYFGMLSMITPPICFATFAAAAVAGCSFWQAGWAGVRLGIVAYIIPFIFVIHPELLLIGSSGAIAFAISSAVVGVILIAAGCAGYWLQPLGLIARSLMILSGLCLVPSPAAGNVWLAVNLAGALLAVGITLAQRWSVHRMK